MTAITLDGQILEALEQGDATAAQLREQMIAARTCVASPRAVSRALTRLQKQGRVQCLGRVLWRLRRGGGEGLARILEAARQLPPGSAVSVPAQWGEALMERGAVRRVSVHARGEGPAYVLEVVELVEKGHVPIETVPRRRAASPEEQAQLPREDLTSEPHRGAILSPRGAP